MNGLRPACALLAVHGVLDAARTLGEGLPAVTERVGVGIDDVALAARSDTEVLLVPPEARRGGPDLRSVADTALVRAGGSGPLVFRDRTGPLAVAVDGRATNGAVLRSALVARGAVLAGGDLAELVVHLAAQSEQRTLMNRLVDALQRVEGGFALVVLPPQVMIAARDPRGLRPLCIGRRGGGRVIASEAGALRASGAIYERDVEPGEVIVLDGVAAESLRPLGRQVPRPCVAEWAGIGGADASVSGVEVAAARVDLGAAVASAFPVRCDAVVPLPGSEALAAGFSERSGARLLPALVASGGQVRSSGAVLGLRVVLLVNVLSTGERARRAVAALRQAGASEVHVRLGAQPVSAPCLYGVGGAVEEELLARRLDIARMRAWLDADSLAHPERAAVLQALGRTPETCCDGCFSGDYPVIPLDPQVPLFPGAPSGW